MMNNKNNFLVDVVQCCFLFPKQLSHWRHFLLPCSVLILSMAKSQSDLENLVKNCLKHNRPRLAIVYCYSTLHFHIYLFFGISQFCVAAFSISAPALPFQQKLLRNNPRQSSLRNNMLLAAKNVLCKYCSGTPPDF